MKINLKRILGLALVFCMLPCCIPAAQAAPTGKNAVTVFQVDSFTQGLSAVPLRVGSSGNFADGSLDSYIRLTYNGDGTVTLGGGDASKSQNATAVLSKDGKGIWGSYWAPGASTVDYGDDYELKVTLKADEIGAKNQKGGAISVCFGDGAKAFMMDITQDGLQIYKEIYKSGSWGQLYWASSTDANVYESSQTIDTAYHTYTFRVKNGNATVYFDTTEIGTYPMLNQIAGATPYQDVLIIAESGATNANGAAQATIKSMSLVTYKDTAIEQIIEPESYKATKTVSEFLTGQTYAWGKTTGYTADRSTWLRYSLPAGKDLVSFSAYCAGTPNMNNIKLMLQSTAAGRQEYENSTGLECVSTTFNGKAYKLKIKDSVLSSFVTTYGEFPQYIILQPRYGDDDMLIISATAEYDVARVSELKINGAVHNGTTLENVDANDVELLVKFNKTVGISTPTDENITVSDGSGNISYEITPAGENVYKLTLSGLKYNTTYTLDIKNIIETDYSATFKTATNDVTVTGEDITEQGGNKKLRINVRNNTSKKMDKVTVVFVSYTNGEMSGCSVKEKSLEKETADWFETELIPAGSTVSYFICRGLSDLTPMYVSQ